MAIALAPALPPAVAPRIRASLRCCAAKLRLPAARRLSFRAKRWLTSKLQGGLDGEIYGAHDSLTAIKAYTPSKSALRLGPLRRIVVRKRLAHLGILSCNEIGNVMTMATIKTFALAAGMSLGAAAASAATLDFTDLETFTSGGASASGTFASGTIGSGASSVIWTLSSVPAKTLKYNFATDSGAPAALRGRDNGFDGRSGSKAVLAESSGLKLDGDGVGSRDDEITFGESVTLTFSQAIRITGIHVLDLFQGFHNGVFGQEVARVTGDIVTSLTADQTKNAGPRHGYRFGAVDSGFTVTSLTFRAGATNDFGDDGVRDFALAGVDYEIAPIPLPAGGLLLLTALAGLAAARRRTKG